MFGQDWIDWVNKYGNQQEEFEEPLTPLAPMPAPPYQPVAPGTPALGSEGPFNPGTMFELPPHLRPEQQAMPMQEASMGGGGGLFGNAMGLGPMGGGAPSGGGGGIFSSIFGGGDEQQPTGGKDWGSMLMALGGGIAGGASQGWGAGIGQGFQNAASVNLKNRAMTQEEAYRQQVLGMKRDAMNAGPDPTSGMREYEMAKAQGYQGSFMDYQTAVRQAGATNVTMNTGDSKFGPISADHQLIMGPDGPTMQVVPGSATEKKQQAESEAAERQSAAEMESRADKADTMLSATKGIKDEITNSTMPATGTMSQPLGVFSNTAAGKVRSYVGTLQSGVALGAMMRLKEASSTGSTGFGAMNEKELQILIDDIGALNPDTTDEKIFLETVDRIERQWKRVVTDVRKTVPRERLREMGLEEFIFGAGGAGGEADPLGIR